MQTLTPSMRSAQNASAAQNYLNSMAISQQTARKSNRSVANSSVRSNFRSTHGTKLDPLPPRASRGKDGGASSVSGKKPKTTSKVDVVLFPSQKSSTDNMIMLSNSGQKSAFQQAYEKAQQKDYISLVANSIPLDINSEPVDGYSDD